MTDVSSSASPDSDATGSRWLDPRVERSRTVILSAALDLLGEAGYGGVTIEAVAARAGVGKSTVYRHWPGKLELIEDAIRTLKAGVTVATTGSVRDRLVGVLRQMAENMAGSTWSTCLPAVIDAAERDPEVLEILRRIGHERRRLLVDLLAEGRSTGAVPDVDLNLLAECLVGPIVLRRLLLHEPFEPDAVPRLVDQLLATRRS